MKTTQSEKKIQTDIMMYLKAQDEVYVVKTMRMNVNGVPDILCCVSGRFLGIEVKAEGKCSNTTELQLRNLASIRASKGYALVTDKLQDVVTTVERIKEDGKNR